MEYNRKRHKTLEFLSNNFIKFNSVKVNNNFVLGKSFEDLSSELKLNRYDCEKVFSILELEKEVGFTNTKVTGLYLTKKGLNSFTSRKYLKENERIVLNWFKVFTQIVIPILSLVIAVLVLTLKFNSITESVENKVNKSHKLKLKHLELKLDSILQLENTRKNNPIFQNHKPD